MIIYMMKAFALKYNVFLRSLLCLLLCMVLTPQDLLLMLLVLLGLVLSLTRIEKYSDEIVHSSI